MGLLKSLTGDRPSPAHGEEDRSNGRASQATSAEQPPPYHDWQSAVPDTSLLPPPPSLTHLQSPTGNAQEVEAVRAHEWCQRYPLFKPHQPTSEQVNAVKAGMIELQRPREFNGSLTSIEPGLWKGSTKPGARDCALIGSLPLYFENVHSPRHTHRPKTIYFEVKVLSYGGRTTASDENAIAVGFCSVPYPTWRMPGWERGSVGVHSDDGRRYVNDTEGGVDFTAPFKPGETIGIGINFSPPDSSSSQALKGKVFLTRDGADAGGWDIHEEMDSETEFGTLGIDGAYDLYAAVGVFGEVEFEVAFQPRRWMWNP